MGAKLAIVFFFLMAGMGAAGAWYYNDTQERLAILQENNAKLETAVQTNEANGSAFNARIFAKIAEGTRRFDLRSRN